MTSPQFRYIQAVFQLYVGQKLTDFVAQSWHCFFKRFSHTHPFNGPLSGTTQVSRYQKGKTNLDFTEARDSGWQWHQLSHMPVCTSLQADNHASTPPLCFFTGRVPFLSPNKQCQSTEGTKGSIVQKLNAPPVLRTQSTGGGRKFC